jgi:signal transduction histidine kinase/DNA-binding response OmpR family regulator/uncharacterized protein (DUF427 family)
MKSVVARWNGKIIAESDYTIVLEGNHYFPPESLVREHFEESSTTTECPWKGTASYLSIVVDGETNEDACWVYRDTSREAIRIRNHYAFWRGVEIEKETDKQRDEKIEVAARAMAEDEGSAAERFVAALRGLDHDALMYALEPEFIHRLSFFNFHNSTTACFRADDQQIVRTVNPTFEWAFSEILDPTGLHLSEMLEALGLTRDQLAEAETKLNSHGWVKIPQVRVRKEDGDEYYSLDAVLATHGDLPELSGIQGQFIDITQEVLATQRLEALRADLERLVEARTAEVREAHLHLRSVLLNISDGLLVTDQDGAVEIANPALQRMFEQDHDPTGSAVEPAYGRQLADLVRTAATGVTASSELRLPRERVGKAVASPVLGQDDSLSGRVGCVVVIRDITFEKEVDRMKTDFIANVSHELRTPLTSILGFAKIIDRRFATLVDGIGELDPKRARARSQIESNLEIIVSEGERLSRLINDVLDIAKMEAGKMEWHSDAVALSDVVRHAAEASAPLFADRPVELEVEVEDVPTVRGDGERLLQVVLNLISNASKFTNEGSVRCSVGVRGDELIVAVADTGLGIDDEDLERIFEKFKQAGDTLTDKPVGTGLGLALCRHVVEHHEGRIWAESRIGSGTTITFALPLAISTRSAAQRVDSGDAERLMRDLDKVISRRAPRERPRGSDHGQADVLVVDDDPSIRALLRTELEQLGYRVREAQDGVKALAEIRRALPNLVVLDVMMPNMDGFDVAAVLKNNPRSAHVPIVIHSVLEDVERGLRIGVDRYFTKTTDLDGLLRAVGELLELGASRKRVLVVDEDESAVRSLSSILRARGYTVDALEDGPTPDAALEAIKRFQPDAVIVDALFPESRDLIQALRFGNDTENIVVLVLGDAESTNEEE